MHCINLRFQTPISLSGPLPPAHLMKSIKNKILKKCNNLKILIFMDTASDWITKSAAHIYMDILSVKESSLVLTKQHRPTRSTSVIVSCSQLSAPKGPVWMSHWIGAFLFTVWSNQHPVFIIVLGKRYRVHLTDSWRSGRRTKVTFTKSSPLFLWIQSRSSDWSWMEQFAGE